MYNKALKLLSTGQLSDSEKILQQLIEENIPQLENQGGLPKTMSTIKYSCYINLGRIFSERGSTKDALENYLMVLVFRFFFFSCNFFCTIGIRVG